MTRALIVDDEPAIAEFVQAVLETAGIRAEMLTDSRQAAARLPVEKFDVVFLDVHMPAPDGIELARLMRAGGYNQNTTLVMLTGETDLALQKKAFEAGANFFLFKPIDRQRLLRLVRTTQATVLHEKRRFQRIPISRKVSVVRNQETLAGRTTDLSLGGMLVETPAVFPEQSVVAVFLDLESGGPLRSRGKVVRVVGDRHMGIQFLDLNPADNERLQEFLLPHILRQLDKEA